jgi:tRNA(Ile)-lysidine synthase TilS/MesJ
MRVCANCVLPDTFPGIGFDETGVCNFCRDFKGMENLEVKKAEYRQKFDSLVEECRGSSAHDALVCYSGGKDSSHTLAVLRQEYGLNLLAITFDNGFLPQKTCENVRNVVENLGVDHIFMKPRFDVLAKIFRECAQRDIYPPKTLERASTICTSCMAIVKFTALRFCLEENIPLIAFGWSPGQAPMSSSIMKNNPRMVRINVNPLAFLDYEEEHIYERISQLGWEAPAGVDANSTNCLLNSFANAVHKKRCGFHPYAFELANLVREGCLDRSSALQRIEQQECPHTVASVGEKLRI